MLMPELPYNGSSGWSGSETSKERADRADASGETANRQQTVLDMLNTRGHAGLTVKELRETTGWHHGLASGTLSALHKAGTIQRLKGPRRTRCKVYVAVDYVAGRETEPQGVVRLCEDCRAAL